MKKYKAMLAGAALLAAPVLSLAGAINIDIQGDQFDGSPGWWKNIGTFTGMAAAPGVGTQWNGVNYPFGDAFSGTLTDDQGNMSDVKLYSHGTMDHWSVNTGAASLLMQDYCFNKTPYAGNDTDAHFTIHTDTTDGGSGFAITGGQRYDIYIYSQGDTAGATTFRLKQDGGNVTQTATSPGAFTGAFSQNVNYVVFKNVAPTAWANGFEFDISWGCASGTGAINGIQVVNVTPGM